MDTLKKLVPSRSFTKLSSAKVFAVVTILVISLFTASFIRKINLLERDLRARQQILEASELAGIQIFRLIKLHRELNSGADTKALLDTLLAGDRLFRERVSAEPIIFPEGNFSNSLLEIERDLNLIANSIRSGRKELLTPLVFQSISSHTILQHQLRTLNDTQEQRNIQIQLQNTLIFTVGLAVIFLIIGLPSAFFVERREAAISLATQALMELSADQNRLRSESAVIASRLALATEAAGLGTWEWHPQTDRAIFNDTWLTMLGYLPGDIESNGAGWLSLLHPEDRDRVTDTIKKHFNDPSSDYRVEFRMKRKSGELAWILAVGRLLEQGADGEPLRMAGIHIDITKQKQIEERLRGQSEELEYAEEVAGLGHWSYDLTTGVTSWSKHLYTVLARPISAGPPATFEEVLQDYTPESGERLREAVAEAATEGTGYSLILERPETKSGARFIRADARVRVGADGKPIALFGTAWDVTAGALRERALIEAKHDAELADRTKSEFLANMSHEIRTPLNGILGTVQLCLDHELPQEVKELLTTTMHSAENLTAVINDILDFSKLEAGKLQIQPTPMLLSRLISQVVQSQLVRIVERQIEHVVFVDPKLPQYILQDELRVSQILNNLLSNAIKFTPDNGAIVIVAKLSARGTLQLSVSDTGIGIPTARLEAIFSAFTQADSSTTRRFGGTGLGLAISKKLSVLLDGDISVRSKLGIGSTFILSLPLLPSTEEEYLQFIKNESLHGSERVICGDTPFKILLVEDNPVNQMVASKILEREGCVVTVAANGRIGLEQMLENGDSFDIVFMDCQMPELSGYEATEQFRKAASEDRKSLPIIAMTANALEGDRERCLASGMDDYITKPINRKRLRKLLLSYASSTRDKTSDERHA